MNSRDAVPSDGKTSRLARLLREPEPVGHTACRSPDPGPQSPDLRLPAASRSAQDGATQVLDFLLNRRGLGF
jgi:hypothetical protein